MSFLCLGAPSFAWTFTPGLPCLLTHDAGDAQISLTFDPTKPLYSVSVTRQMPWPPGDIFAMRFEGASGLEISTRRHRIEAEGSTVTVTDTGFGNVLNGLQFNDRAVAILGGVEVAFSLANASEPVAAFRLCRAAPGV